MTSLLERFISRVLIPEGDDPDLCWLWQGNLDEDGYGILTIRPRGTLRAHRVAWEIEHGAPPPRGVPLDHRCHDGRTCAGGRTCPHRPCVRMSHLAISSPKDNAERSTKALATHCINDHEFTPENTYRKPNGTRLCRACRAARARTSDQRVKRAEAARRYRARQRAKKE